MQNRTNNLFSYARQGNKPVIVNTYTRVYVLHNHTIDVDSSLMTMPTLVNQEEAKSTELLALGSPEMDGSTFEELMKERTRVS